MLFSRPSLTISWKKPKAKPRRPEFKIERGALPMDMESGIKPLAPPPNSLREAIQNYGVPVVKGLTPEEELIFFLKMAAEVEHGLMIQYLYAANGTLDAEMARTITNIAVEEMGHLLTVQNLLLAMNEKPYLGRYDKAKNPLSPFAFSLQPLNRLALAKFTSCERPDEAHLDPEDLLTYQEIIAELTASGTGVEPDRVGLLYAKIYWLLRETDDVLPDPSQEEWPDFPVEEMKKLFPPNNHVRIYPAASPVLQGERADWYESHPTILIYSARTKTEARVAIAGISSQGEGFGAGEDGHFDHFISLYRKAQTGVIIERNVPINPWYQGINSTGGDEITETTAVSVAKLADLIYEILLNYIALAIHPDQTDLQKRSNMASFCIMGMVRQLRLIARGTQNLPISTASGSKNFGQCYTMPKGSEEIAEIRARLQILLPEIRGLCMELAGSEIVEIAIAADEILASVNEAPPTEILT